jgi:phospholipase A1/A2
MVNPRNPIRSVALLGAILGMGGQAAAQTVAPSMASCAAIAADQERLACYDRASGRLAAGQPEPEHLPMTAPAAPGGAFAGTAQALTAKPAEPSIIDSAWGFEPDSDRYSIQLYRPNYLLLASYSTRPNEAPFAVLFDALEHPDGELKSTEAEFQLSFKARLWTTDNRRFGVWAAYTQNSQWQVYNDELSRPFRETNYQPELIASYNPDLSFGGFHWQLFNFGYNHQSNGRSDPISRSWDRLIAEFGIERGNFAVLVRPWIVINDGGDDNPDITDYYGHGDITAVYKWRGNSFALMGRGNLSTEKGAARLTWTSPPFLGPLRGYVSAFTGYGESMIDYDWKQNVFGIGIALNDVLDGPRPCSGPCR